MEQSISKVVDIDGVKLNVDELTVDTVISEQTFSELFKVKDTFRRSQWIDKVRQRAAELKITQKRFDTLLKAYRDKYIQEQKRRLEAKDNFTKFENQSLELFCGDWIADDYGVKTTEFNKEGMAVDMYACPHPILMTERYINLDTRKEKAKIEFYKDGKWQDVIVDKRMIASRQDIVNLSTFGVQVTSETAPYLVRYFFDLESLNSDKITCCQSTERLGWIDYTNEFIPYVDNIKFDGEANNKALFECVREGGIEATWLETARAVRTNEIVRILLATSLSSPIISKLNKLPFFVHIWGGSGTGKTVALMVAASVWGNPDQGKLVRGLNSTAVGLERLAAFFNNIPCFLNELQTIKNNKNFDDIIYKLGEGVGKERGNKYGGNEKLTTWKCCFITNGEQGVISDNSSAGAANRIIEIEVNEGLFEDAKSVVDVVKENYGFAGKRFVEFLQNKDIAEIKADFDEIYTLLIKSEITEKQAMAASLICIADKYANELFWHDEPLDVDDIYKYLKRQCDVDPNLKAVEAIKQWLVSNKGKFNGDDKEQWGKIDLNDYVVMSNVLAEFLRSKGFDEKAVYKHLAKTALVEVRDGKATHPERIKGMLVRVLRFKNLLIDLTPTDEATPFD
jgi:putative DNA primase/helicase